MKLTATRSFLYNTRRLLAGDDFETVKPIHGKLLIAAKKARERREPGKLSAPPLIVTDKVTKAERKHKVDPTEQPPAVTQPQPADDTAAAREEYQAKVGRRPFMGWDADTVRAKMAENAPDDSADIAADAGTAGAETETDDAAS